MKEFVGLAFNASLVEHEDRDLSALAEIVIIVSEPVFSVDMAGDMVRSRAVEQFRFGIRLLTLRALIKQLEAYADEMEDLEDRHDVELPPTSPKEET